MSLEGQELGRYRLQQLLGSGGMGEVYLATDISLNRQVAIKVIRAEAASYPEAYAAKEAVRLFQRELRAIAALDHPHILPLFDYGEESAGRTTLTYMVMPFRTEGSLADWLHRRAGSEVLSPQDIEDVLRQAASALQYAHDQQILHQDVKPSNFLVRRREQQPDRPDVLLADFGVAKFTSATASMSQAIRGTPAYMAPEQWEGSPVPATDQYALAVMAYELLTGRLPFQGGMAQMMYQHFHVQPQPPSTYHPRIPHGLDAVLLRALAKQPGDRFPSVTAFAQAFQEAVQGEGDLHATLAISRAEAESGTTRTLTLPGGRQVSVTVPAGVSDGTALRLEGQGMPYYEGGPSGPLVLTIAIPAEASPLPLPQDSMEPTVAVSLPNAELPAVEDLSVPPSRPEAPGELEPAVPATNASETASTVLATDATSLPTELATPAHHTALPAEPVRSETPAAVRPDALVAVKPVKRKPSRRFVLLGLAGLVIVALASGIAWFTTHQAPPAGRITVFPVPTASNFPTEITAGPDGNLWFTEKGSQKNEGKIGRITPTGSITEFPLPTSCGGSISGCDPRSITAGPDGNLWFTEEFGNQIGRISPDGTITEFPTTPTVIQTPEGITAGPDGNLWFTDLTGDNIGRITSGK